MTNEVMFLIYWGLMLAIWAPLTIDMIKCVSNGNVRFYRNKNFYIWLITIVICSAIALYNNPFEVTVVLKS